jgi:hypothetical protein
MIIFLVTKFQNRGSEHDHGLLCIKDAPIYGINTNEYVENFINKYISCHVSLLPITLQNAQQHQHIRTCKKKNHVVCEFHYPLPLMSKTTILKPFELKEDLPFSKKNCNNKQQQILKILKILKLMKIFFLNLKIYHILMKKHTY